MELALTILVLSLALCVSALEALKGKDGPQ